MTYEEALNKSFDGIVVKGKEYFEVPVEYFETADKAFEILTSKIPKLETVNHGIDITGEYDIEYNCLCPVCGNVVGDFENEEMYFKYCPECGQKIEQDWSKIL